MAQDAIISIMERTLNYVDDRLMNHGRRVAYLVYRALKKQGGHTEAALRDACVLALLHDVGAYKTEEIDRLLEFETRSAWPHSVYGYLYIKTFSPLRAIAPAVLFHHADCDELSHLAPRHRLLAHLLHVADRYDIFSRSKKGRESSYRQYFQTMRGTKFLPEAVELFFAEEGENSLLDGWRQDAEFERLLSQSLFSEEDIEAYLNTIVTSIDFRSSQTVSHTFIVARAGAHLARLMGMREEESRRIQRGAMYHDIGKIGIPLRILEKPGRLEEREMQVMRQHILLTREILKGQVDAEVLELAARHHEKLDGTGYPEGLTAAQLTHGQRLLAVADIYSALAAARSYKEPFPKEKVLGIIGQMTQAGQLDAEIVGLLRHHYDTLSEQVRLETRPLFEAYAAINAEYDRLLALTDDFSATPGTGEIGGM